VNSFDVLPKQREVPRNILFRAKDGASIPSLMR
jgi:hypothetical protein